MKIYPASELFEITKKKIEEEECEKVIKNFILSLNRETYAAASRGEFNVAISAKLFPVKYRQQIFEVLSTNGYEILYRSFLDDYIVSWGDI